jgi:hypothetical protein
LIFFREVEVKFAKKNLKDPSISIKMRILAVLTSFMTDHFHNSGSTENDDDTKTNKINLKIVFKNLLCCIPNKLFEPWYELADWYYLLKQLK